MKTWDNLKERCLACYKCDLSACRTQVVFGAGNPNAEVWFVGEAPGANEDEQGLPFVGRSGKLLDKYLASIDLYRDKNVFITNIVKCRPPKNRDPLPKERETCLPWLREQLATKQPKIVVCVGRVAAQVLIRPKYLITKEHGMWEQIDKIAFTSILHPAAILRNPRQSILVENDLVVINRKIKNICTGII